MTTKEVAEKLVAHCRKAAWETAQRELYAQDVVSTEPYATPSFPQETRGLAAIIDKGRKFDALIEPMQDLKVSDPLVATNSFACTMRMDVTMREQGRMQMTELCVSEVKDGKIVAERFHV